MLPQRIFWKLFLALLGSVGIAFVLFGGLLYRNLYRTTLTHLKDNLKKQTEALAQTVTESDDLFAHPEAAARAIHTEDRITIMSPEGTVVADNWAERLGKEEIENHWNRPEFQAALRGSPIFVQRVSRTVEQEMLYYAVPLKKNGRVKWVLRLSFPLTFLESQMKEIRNFLLGTALVAMILSLPFAYFFSLGITSPLQRLRQSAHALASGDLSRRVSPEGSKEVCDLAEDFNLMANRLQQNFQMMELSRERMEALLSNMVEGVFTIDGNGKAVFANGAFCGMTGTHREKIEGRSVLEITRNPQLADFVLELLASKGEENIESREIHFYTNDEEKIFSVQASRVPEGDHPGLLLLVFHDITRIKKVEQMRRDFVANVSHELRTPLTALKGAMEALLDGAYRNPEQSRRFLEMMNKQLENIQNLVTDMLELARVEDVRVPLRREEIILNHFLKDIADFLQPLARDKRQQLVVHLPEETIVVNIDPRQMGDAIRNILDNAVRYTQENGNIVLSASQEGKEVVVQITDNGPGIPEDQLPRIFERFYRVDKSRSREIGGTGLGLSIAKHAVENHGGTISVTSKIDHGTTFTIRFPKEIP